jgi:hypothetical protein
MLLVQIRVQGEREARNIGISRRLWDYQSLKNAGCHPRTWGHPLDASNPIHEGYSFVLLNGRGALPSPLAMLLVQIRVQGEREAKLPSPGKCGA